MTVFAFHSAGNQKYVSGENVTVGHVIVQNIYVGLINGPAGTSLTYRWNQVQSGYYVPPGGGEYTLRILAQNGDALDQLVLGIVKERGAEVQGSMPISPPTFNGAFQLGFVLRVGAKEPW